MLAWHSLCKPAVCDSNRAVIRLTSCEVSAGGGGDGGPWDLEKSQGDAGWEYWVIRGWCGGWGGRRGSPARGADNLGERRSCRYSIVRVRWGVLERGDRGSLGVGGPPEG